MALNLSKIQQRFKEYQSGGGSDNIKKKLKGFQGGRNFGNFGNIKKKSKGFQSGRNSDFNIDLSKFNKPTDNKVDTEGSNSFNEEAGKYTESEVYNNNQANTSSTTTDTNNSINNSNTSDTSDNSSSQAQEYKDTYENNLKDYMNYNDDKITNTTTSGQNNINQNAGNKEDWTTNIGNTNDIKYSNIGNDYSVNIGGIGDGFSNMQGAAAYTALNNNQYYRSSSEMNGLKRASQASEQATGLVGAKDRSANLYNSVGYSQNYWGQKADAQQNFYLGDIYAQKAPEYQLPSSPSNPMDNDTTQDTLDNFKKDLR